MVVVLLLLLLPAVGVILTVPDFCFFLSVFCIFVVVNARPVEDIISGKKNYLNLTF